MHPLYCTFPGDAQLPYDALWRTHCGWLASAIYAQAAATASGITVSRQTLERWLRFGAFALLLDQLIDDQPPEHRPVAHQIYSQLVSGVRLEPNEVPEWVNPDLLVVAGLFHNATHELQRQSEIQPLALLFLEHASAKARETNPQRYSAEVAQEGRLMGYLMAELMTSGEREGRHHRRFAKWFGQFAAGGALFDAARDLRRDFESQRSSVEPTAKNRRTVLARSLWTSAQLLLHPKIFGRTFVAFAKFWGMPIRLHKSWGRPAAAWQRFVREAQPAPESV